MQHATQVRLIESLFAHIDAQATCLADKVTRIPVEAYTAPERMQRERAKLFETRPLALGLSTELREPGSFVTNDRAGVPVVMTRDFEGRARAFLNVCRHRGARVAVEEYGRVRKVLTCPYHGWSYGLDGKLVHRPHGEAFEGVDPACHGLTELPSCERHGLIWAGLRPGPEHDVAAYLEGLDAELASFDLGRYHLYGRRVIEQPFNWKIAIDTFLEPYHFGVLHANSIAPFFFHDVCLVDRFGPHLREVLPRKSVLELREQPQGDWNLPDHSALVYVLFPNTVWVVQRDHIELWRIYPDLKSPDRCSMTMDFLVPEPATTPEARMHWRRNLDILLHTTLNEDFPTGATIQAGLDSGAQSHVTFGRNEPALAYFETTVAESI